MKCLYNNNNNKYVLCVRRSLYDEKLTRACAVIVLCDTHYRIIYLLLQTYSAHYIIYKSASHTKYDT